MRREPSRAWRAAAARGFTLIEILVVLVIIAVMTGAALYRITVTGVDRGLESEGDRLADVIKAATQQSGLEGRDLGLRFQPDHYEVLAYSAFKNRWQALPDDRLFEAHTVPDGVGMSLSVEGKPVLLKAPAEDEPVSPQVVISGAGDTSTYRLTFTRDGSDHTFVVEGLADGTLELHRPGRTP